MKVRDIMTTELVTAAVGDPFRHVVQVMLDAGVGGLPVVDTEGSLVGIVTEADLVAKEAHPGGHRLLGALMSVLSGTDENWWRKSEGSTAGELMSRAPITVGPDDSIQTAARRMLSHRIGRMPVVDTHGRLVGIVARADLIGVYERSDEQLRADIYDVVHGPSQQNSGDDIDFEVDDARVSLTGTVSSASHRRALLAAVWAVPGVVDVVSRLEEPRPGPDEAEGVLDRLRHSGVGVEDPNIWPEPGLPLPPRESDEA